MKYFLSKLKNLGTEILIILGFIFKANFFLGEVNKSLQSDGLGYYDYLPSIFSIKILLEKMIQFKKIQIYIKGYIKQASMLIIIIIK